MIPPEWKDRNEKELTADQVKRLEPGTKVKIISADRYGGKNTKVCTVAQSYKKKVLIYRDGYTWEKEVIPIKAGPNRMYVIQKGE